MKKFGVNYAVLTTINRTWFFKFENKKMLISKQINSEIFLKAMYYLVKISSIPSKCTGSSDSGRGNSSSQGSGQGASKRTLIDVRAKKSEPSKQRRK
jgi:hypothetical protein